MPDFPADAQGRPGPNRRHDEEPQLDVRRDALTPDLRAQAEARGLDPEEVDPLTDDEETLRRASMGGSANLG